MEWCYDLLTRPSNRCSRPRRVRRAFTLEGAEAAAGDPNSMSSTVSIRSSTTTCCGPSQSPAASRASGCWRRSASTRSGGPPSAATARRCGVVTRLLRPLAEKADRHFGPKQRSSLERLDAELAKIRGPLTSAVESGRQRSGCGSGHRSGATGSCGDPTGRAASVWSCCCPVTLGSDAVRARAQWVVASLASPQGDHETVCRLVEVSLPVHRELGDDVVGLRFHSVSSACRFWPRARRQSERVLSPRKGSRSRAARAISRRRQCSSRTSASFLPRTGSF